MSAAEKTPDVEWISTRRAADLCGVEVATVRRWIESGYLDGYRPPGGHWRVSRESVVAVLQRWRNG